MGEKYSKYQRRCLLFEFINLGLNQRPIAESLSVSTRTIRRDMKSQTYRLLVEEMIRKQFAEINKSGLETRLEYRDKLLSKLMRK